MGFVVFSRCPHIVVSTRRERDDLWCSLDGWAQTWEGEVGAVVYSQGQAHGVGRGAGGLNRYLAELCACLPTIYLTYLPPLRYLTYVFRYVCMYVHT